EDARAEQPVPLRLEGAVVDRLRLLDLAIGPGADLLRARHLDLDLVEGLRLARLAQDLHQLVHAITFSGISGRRSQDKKKSSYSEEKETKRLSVIRVRQTSEGFLVLFFKKEHSSFRSDSYPGPRSAQATSAP